MGSLRVNFRQQGSQFFDISKTNNSTNSTKFKIASRDGSGDQGKSFSEK
jgi:hypothetical protein